MTEHYDPQHLTGRDANGRFSPGNSGRPKGSKNKVAVRFLESVLADYEAHQEDVLARLRQKHVSEYMRAVSRLLPKRVEVVAGPPEDCSEDEIFEAWRDIKRAIEEEPDMRRALIKAEMALCRLRSEVI
jgi:hypothetical protein